MYRLLIGCDGVVVDERAIENDTITIGRRTGNDICLLEPTVSACHARINVGGGNAVLEDLGSTNGTFVNGERVLRRSVDDGDIIAIGRHTITVTETSARNLLPKTLVMTRQRRGPENRICWVAQDNSGTWWGFTDKPMIEGSSWQCRGRATRLKPGRPNPQWQSTLRHV